MKTDTVLRRTGTWIASRSELYRRYKSKAVVVDRKQRVEKHCPPKPSSHTDPSRRTIQPSGQTAPKSCWVQTTGIRSALAARNGATDQTRLYLWTWTTSGRKALNRFQATRASQGLKILEA